MFTIIILSALVGLLVSAVHIGYTVHAAKVAEQRAICETARRQAEEREAVRRQAAQAAAAAAEKARQQAAQKAAQKTEQERKKAEREAARIQKEEERARKMAEKLQAARELAEYRERELQAARELQALKSAPQRPETILTPDPEPDEEQAAQAQADIIPAQDNAAKPFKGHTVSFTGKLSNMRRKEAIEKVRAAGGMAFADMPAGTTLLVVGSNPGMQKLDKADKWIGQVRKITEQQFIDMLSIA